MKVVHVITCLDTGGGNVMLYRLLSHTDPAVLESEVISLTDIGPIGHRIRILGVPVRAIGMRRGSPNPWGVVKLARWLRQDAPDVVQTWGYHADLVGGLATRLAGRIPVVWGIHHTTFDPQGTKRMTVWTAKACGRLSRSLATRIVCCSQASGPVHAALGYDSDRMTVIHNGFDLSLFKPDLAARQAVREELGIPGNAPLIGLIARFDPQKDHRNFILAAGLLHVQMPECHFLLCGHGINWDNLELDRWIGAAGIGHRCHLLGERADVPRLTAALDIASTASSFGEAFPLVIGEAMACGVPCVVTDVGDSALLVGDTGRVVPPRNPQALADGWMSLLCDIKPEERRRLGLAARQRIEERYSIERIAAQYCRLYRDLATGFVPYRLSARGRPP